MSIHVLICDETSSPPSDRRLEIPFPPVPVAIKTVVRIAIRRARRYARMDDKDTVFLPTLYGIDVILNMRLVRDIEADSVVVPDGANILILNHFVSPTEPKKRFHEV